jgi:hypothetical protein
MDYIKIQQEYENMHRGAAKGIGIGEAAENNNAGSFQAQQRAIEKNGGSAKFSEQAIKYPPGNSC